jgi:hypothetical protein
LRCYRCGFDSDHRILRVDIALPTTPDHYPWSDTAERAIARADLLLAVVAPFLPAPSAPAVADALALVGIPPPVVAPAPPLDMQTPPPIRVVKRGFYMCCSACGMVIDYCNCTSRARSTAAPDGAHSDLSKRIAELRGRDSR